jgi:hypothetical protein
MKNLKTTTTTYHTYNFTHEEIKGIAHSEVFSEDESEDLQSSSSFKIVGTSGVLLTLNNGDEKNIDKTLRYMERSFPKFDQEKFNTLFDFARKIRN